MKILLIVLLIINSLDVLANKSVVIGKNVLTMMAGSKKITVTVDVGAPYGAECESWGWGAEKRCPQTAIRSISLTVNGEPVFIRSSSFSDLGSPKKLSLTEDKNKYYLTVRGGDAAGSYAAVLRFSRTGLEYRKVVSGEFPDDAWEETFYGYPAFE